MGKSAEISSYMKKWKKLRSSPWASQMRNFAIQECLPPLVTAKDKLYFIDNWTNVVHQLVAPNRAIPIRGMPKKVVALVAEDGEYSGAKPRIFEIRDDRAREFDPDEWSWSSVDPHGLTWMVLSPVLVNPRPEGPEVVFSKMPALHEWWTPWRRPYP